MSLELTSEQLAAAQLFLEDVPASYRRRGLEYYRERTVRSLRCEQPNRTYMAQVQGSALYDVTLFYEDGGWAAECSCPLQFDCKHCVAAMLTLLEKNGTPVNVAGPRAGVPPAARASPTLLGAITEKLGHTPEPADVKLIGKLQALYQRTSYLRSLQLNQLLEVFPSVPGNTWDFLTCWPRPPRNEVEWWEMLALALAERRVKIPPALLTIVDRERIQRELAAWKRDEEVARWQRALVAQPPNGDDPASPASASRSVAVRLRLGRTKVELECREAGATQFQKVKSTHFRSLTKEFEDGRLAVTPESYALWLPFYQYWVVTGLTTFDVRNPNVRRLVGSLLRQLPMREHIVGANGLALHFVEQPLRWELSDQANGYGDYRLRLRQANGEPAPEVWWMLDGQPRLHVTGDNQVFMGPSPLQVPGHNLTTTATEAVLPKPVVESPAGLRFLHRLGAPLPAGLRDQVKHVPLKLRFTVKLGADFGGGENALLKVQAVAKGYAEVFGAPDGWIIERNETNKTSPLIIHERAALGALPRLIQVPNWKWNTYEQQWQLRVTRRFPEEFAAWLAALPGDAEVKLDRELASLQAAPLRGKVRLDCEPSGVDWFDLRIILDVADTKLAPDELQALLNARGGFVRLKGKGWQRLAFDITAEEDAELARLGLRADEFTAEPQRFHALQLADRAARRFLPAAQVAAIHRRASEIQTRVQPPLPAGVNAPLRPYQIEGFHFLAYLSANNFGGILADDMGLGKTLQTLTWLAWLREQTNDTGKPALVVCPKSVMDNWRAETERFVPGLRVHLWTGTGAARLPDTLKNTDLLVVNYTQLRALGAALAGITWRAAILDEGQYIKNPESQTARAARALKAEQRLVLTGTPIENRLLDLWSLMSFAMPGVLGQRAQFTRNFDKAEDGHARQRLAARVRPFLLRRTKGQVARELPDRIEEDLVCEMEPAQRTLYRAELKRAQQMLLKVKTAKEFDQQRFNFLTSLLRLRQICCHPGLLNAENASAGSAKLEALADLLEPLMAEGHKVLVFSQFVTMIELIRPLLTANNWPHFILTGATENRGELVAEFQNAPGAAVFLISLKAGGFGLNLTGASYVVLFDPWWNPAVENQAIDRTHRIGQTRHVNAYRLLIKDTIEEKIRSLQKTKSALASDVLGEERFAQSLSLDDLRFLLTDAA